MDITMTCLIMEVIDDLETELILNMEMNTLRNHGCCCKIHRVGPFIQ